MAKPWSAVAESEAYRTLAPEQQEAARNQYFEDVVAPKVPEAERPAARAQFDSQTGPRRDLADRFMPQDSPATTAAPPRLSSPATTQPAAAPPQRPAPASGSLAPARNPIQDQADRFLEESIAAAPRGSPGLMGGIEEFGRGIARGTLHTLPSMVGKSLQFADPEGGSDVVRDVGTDIVESAERRLRDNPWMQETQTGRRAAAESAWDPRGAAGQAGEMLVPSSGPGLVGAGIGAMAGGPVGAAVGFGVGSLLSLPLFFGSQAQDTYERAEPRFRRKYREMGLSSEKAAERAHDEAFRMGLKTGSIEAGGELIADLIPIKILSAAPPAARRELLRAATKGIKGPVAMLKDMSKIVGTEVATEVGQGAGQQAVEASGGVGEPPTWDSVKGVILPTAMMSLITAGGVEMAGSAGRRQVRKALEDPNVDAATRRKAVESIARQLRSRDKELADLWTEHAMPQVERGEPVVAPQDPAAAPMDAGEVIGEETAAETAERARAAPDEEITLETAPVAESPATAGIEVDEGAPGTAGIEVAEATGPEAEALRRRAQRPSQRRKSLPRRGEDVRYDVGPVPAEGIQATELTGAEAERVREQMTPPPVEGIEVEDITPPTTEGIEAEEITPESAGQQMSVLSKIRNREQRRRAARVLADLRRARRETDREPTEDQKAAGNYKKGTIRLEGMEIAIENPRGSTRSGTDESGRQWSTRMAHDYGYIKRSEGADGDPVDVFLTDEAVQPRPAVHVVDQVDPETGRFDEHKAVIGPADPEAARTAYLANYDDTGAGRVGAITPMSMEQFKRWAREGDTSRPVAPELQQQAETQRETTDATTVRGDQGPAQARGGPVARRGAEPRRGDLQQPEEAGAGARDRASPQAQETGRGPVPAERVAEESEVTAPEPAEGAPAPAQPTARAERETSPTEQQPTGQQRQEQERGTAKPEANWETILVDRDALDEAVGLLYEAADPDAIPPLDPATWDWNASPIVLKEDGSVLDGNHRIIGVAKWMEQQGMDLGEDFVELPALSVSREVEATHPEGQTPAWWIERVRPRQQERGTAERAALPEPGTPAHEEAYEAAREKARKQREESDRRRREEAEREAEAEQGIADAENINEGEDFDLEPAKAGRAEQVALPGREQTDETPLASGTPVNRNAALDEMAGLEDRLWNGRIEGDQARRRAQTRYNDLRSELGWPKVESWRAPPPQTAAAELRRAEPVMSQDAAAERGMPAADVERALRDRLGRPARRLMDKGQVQVVQSAEHLPQRIKQFAQSFERGLQGVYDPKTRTSYLIADSMRPDTIEGVGLHEIGVHAGLKRMVGREKWGQMVTQLHRLERHGNQRARDAIRRARARIPEGARDSVRDEEAIAYLVEDPANHDMSLVRRIKAAIRAWLFRQGLVRELTTDDYVALARGAVKNLARGDTPLPDHAPATAPGFDPASMGRSSIILASQQAQAVERFAGGQPLDRVFRIPFHVVGSIDAQGRWQPPRGAKKAGKALAGRLHEVGDTVTNHYPWLGSLVEHIKAGVIDRYGLPEDYLERDFRREADQRKIIMEAQDVLQDLVRRGVDAREARILQAVLTGEQIPDADWKAVSEPIRRAIDEMGQEAVALGLISEETYQKHRGTYLHRVYQKHETDMPGLARWMQGRLAGRRKAIVGNQLKGRGMDLKVAVGKLQGRTSGRFRVYDRVTTDAQGNQRLTRRVQSPGQPAPEGQWVDRGTWELRTIRGKQAVLWRDFTKEERQKMGEIVDARYTIAKTYQLMARDLSTGRFLRDIAQNPEWARDDEPQSWANPSDWRMATHAGVEWIKVPDTAIPRTGGKKRWGALSGKYVRAEIWRDLNEVDQMSRSSTWNTLLTQWKVMKTARNPVVHMNNVMSNFLLADMADIRMQDIARAIRSMKAKDSDFRDAQAHNVFGAGFVEHELRREVFDPILDEIARQNQQGEGMAESLTGKFRVFGKIADIVWRKGKRADRWMVNLYQAEDMLFRHATYMRRRAMGDDTLTAAKIARDQFLNYDIRAPWVNAVRRSVLPFISYTYRAVPVIAKSLAERPWKLAKYMTVAYAMNELAYALVPGDEEEERRSMRSEVQGRTWIQTPRMMRMPFRDQWGNPVFLDVRRWIPAGDVFDTNQGQAPVPIPAWFQFGGPLMLAGEFFLNKQAYTGQEIVSDVDTAMEKARKVGMWAWRSWMPSAPWIPGSWYWDKIDRARKGGRDPLGREYSLPLAISSSVGVKLAPQDVEYGFSLHARHFDWRERQIKWEMSQLQKDFARKLIDEGQFRESMDTQIGKLDRLAEDRARVLAGEDISE